MKVNLERLAIKGISNLYDDKSPNKYYICRESGLVFFVLSSHSELSISYEFVIRYIGVGMIILPLEEKPNVLQLNSSTLLLFALRSNLSDNGDPNSHVKLEY